MRLVRPGVLFALVLVGTVAVIATPAFATPNITASSGTRPVTPFITPMGNTRDSSSRASSIDFTLSFGGASLACRTAGLTGYVAITHTQLRVTSLLFGDGRGATCTGTGGMTVDGDSIVSGASSANPWHLHLKTNNAPTRSATGTLNSSSIFSFTLTVGGGSSCIVTVAGPQSLPVTYTYTTTSLVLNGSLPVVVMGVTDPLRLCPAGGTWTVRATYTFRPGTQNHRLVVTTAS